MCHIYVLVSKLPDFEYSISGLRFQVLDFRYSISRQVITQQRERIEVLRDRSNFETRKRQERIDVETVVETIINIPGKSCLLSHSHTLSLSLPLFLSPYREKINDRTEQQMVTQLGFRRTQRNNVRNASDYHNESICLDIIIRRAK